MPPFGEIKPEHYEPAFTEAIAAHEAEIAAIDADLAVAAGGTTTTNR